MRRAWTQEQEDELRAIYTLHGSDLMQLRVALRKFRAKHAFSPDAVRRRAIFLSISRRRYTNWSPSELQKLEEWAGTKSMQFMMRSLKRSRQSIQCKLAAMELRYRCREGYSSPDLMKVLGLGYYEVQRLFKRGYMKPSSDTGRVSEHQVCNFIKLHPEQYSLKRVDEAWFKGMLFPRFGQFAHRLGDKATHNPFEERIA